ncbi:phage holin family protein [Streptomyces sp. NBC_01808]|uniref:phage holin family protein n=1 Tax=Streptomyces sp. NBC_01808 TaxID=2975947 RepID=UPI002DD7D3D2|nr:phage holin family protein [Streptomyces sp. NBC_01808]WSA38735.1 phage holin family protein [Streptomyces sp. NBC_01808]
MSAAGNGAAGSRTAADASTTAKVTTAKDGAGPEPGSDAHLDAQQSLGQLVSTATTNLSALLHDEIALLKAETREDIKRAGAGGAALGIAAVLVLFGIPVLSFAAAYGLHALGLHLAWSFLIVFGVHLLLGALAALWGIAKMRQMRKPERAMNSTKETATVISDSLRGRSHPADRRKPAAGVARSES